MNDFDDYPPIPSACEGLEGNNIFEGRLPKPRLLASRFEEIKTFSVRHDTFGAGRITDVDDFHITVEFSEKTATFAYPDAFRQKLRFYSFIAQREMQRYLRWMGERLERRAARRARRGNDLRYDAVEDTLHFMEIEDEVMEEIERKRGKLRFMGACHLIWMEKKHILKEKYGIDWRSPSELNPDAMFD